MSLELQENNPEEQNSVRDITEADVKRLKNAQTLITIGLVAAPISLFIGGLLLSTVGLVCVIVALVKVFSFEKEFGSTHDIVKRIKRSAMMAIIFCGIAVGLNAYMVATVMPIMMEAIQTGDMTALNEMLGNTTADTAGSGASDSAGTSNGASIWD